MSCIRNFFKCNVDERKSSLNQSFVEERMKFFQSKIIDIELEMKALKVAHDLEIKRIEDKLINQIQILSTKIDALLFQKN